VRLCVLLRRGWPLLVLALVVRVAQVAASSDWVPVADPADYVRHAVSIAHGHGFPQTVLPQGGPSALRPPAYPYLLAAVFGLSGDSETAGRLASALLGVVTVALIGLVAELLWSRRMALVAMAVAAVYPPLVLLSGTLLSEALGLPLLLALVALAVERSRSPATTTAAGVAAGALLGLAVLDRPAFAVLALPVAAGLWGRPWRSLRALRLPALALVVAALVVVPWTVRNAERFHALIPVSDQSGFLIAGTYNPASDHDHVTPGANRPPGVTPAMRRVLATPGLDENQVSRKLGALGRSYGREHPGYVPRVLWWNGLRMLTVSRGADSTRSAYAFQGVGPRWADAALWGFRLLALLALAGVALGAARAMPWWLGATAGLLFVSVIAISGDIRYRLPLEPFFVWAAAPALVAGWDALRGRRPGQRPPPT
jgi:4-amino-4-deoxy-L-arabinose transferase-like glycosyltransferase